MEIQVYLNIELKIAFMTSTTLHILEYLWRKIITALLPHYLYHWYFVHHKSDTITLETSAGAIQSAPHELIKLDSDNKDTISLSGSGANEDNSTDDEIVQDYCEHAENHPETNTSGALILDYTSDILNNSACESINSGKSTSIYKTPSMNSETEQDACDPLLGLQHPIPQIKQELPYFTDSYSSGFMSDGGISTWSQQSNVSTLKTLSLRVLTGMDNWPLPSLKWLCCNATQYLSGNQLHLCWTVTMQRLQCPSPTKTAICEHDSAIKNGITTPERATLEINMLDEKHVMSKDQGGMKNTNSENAMEAYIHPKNGNNDNPINGNELSESLVEAESVPKNANITATTSTTKNKNEPIQQPLDNPALKNANQNDRCTTAIMEKLDTMQEDDSDDDTVIYTSEPECDQNVCSEKEIQEDSSTKIKPCLTRQVSVNIKRMTCEEILSWHSNTRSNTDTSPSAKKTSETDWKKIDQNSHDKPSVAQMRKSGRNKAKTGHEAWYDDKELDIPPSPKRKNACVHQPKGPIICQNTFATLHYWTTQTKGPCRLSQANNRH